MHGARTPIPGIVAAAVDVLLGGCGTPSRVRGCAVAEASTFAGMTIAPRQHDMVGWLQQRGGVDLVAA